MHMYTLAILIIIANATLTNNIKSKMCHGYNYFTDTMSNSLVLNCSVLLKDNNLIINSHDDSLSVDDIKFGSGVDTYEDYAKIDRSDIAYRYELLDTDKTFAAGQKSLTRQTMFNELYSRESYLLGLYQTIQTSSAQYEYLNFEQQFWHSSFLTEVFKLPLEFNVNDINETYIEFWNQYGTHILTKGLFGGRIHGIVLADKCKIDEDYENVETFSMCLTTQFQYAIHDECFIFDEIDINNDSVFIKENIISSEVIAADYIRTKTIQILGGDTTQSHSLLSRFDNYNKDETIQEWISTLIGHESIIGGAAEPIYDYISDIADYIDSSTLIDISTTLEQAYEFYRNQLENELLNIKCNYSCFEGELDRITCHCKGCNGMECCEYAADSAIMMNCNFDILNMLLLFLCLIVIIFGGCDFHCSTLTSVILSIQLLNVSALGLNDICYGYNYFENKLSSSFVLDCTYTVNKSIVNNIDIFDNTKCVYDDMKFDVQNAQSYQELINLNNEIISQTFNINSQNNDDFGGGGIYSSHITDGKPISESLQVYFNFINYLCESYFISIENDYSLLKFSNNFITSINFLPQTFDINSQNDFEDFEIFFNTYGTHLLLSANFGGIIAG
eukprot:281550_1